jgi:hypothetical protein
MIADNVDVTRARSDKGINNLSCLTSKVRGDARQCGVPLDCGVRRRC